MTLRDCWDISGRMGNEDVRRFMRDMKRAGLKSKMRYYAGRNFWTGPAVVVDHLQEFSRTRRSNASGTKWAKAGSFYPVVPVKPKTGGE